MMITWTGEQAGFAANAVEVPVLDHSSRDGNMKAYLRHRLWSAVVTALDHSRLPYCILGASASTAQTGDSDLDFAVRPCDYQYIPQLLASAAAGVGGHLVQAIEHETTATYFAFALQQGETVAFLHPDCTTDYRRQGRLWISSEELLRGRRRAPGGYFRPAPDVEFTYYLTKQVLKQALTDSQWRKLVTFYQASPCPRAALSWWNRAAAIQIEHALLHDNCAAFRQRLPRSYRELIDTPSKESATAKVSSFLSDRARIASRIACPTGLFVQISNGNAAQRSAMAGRVVKTLAPAFRRSRVLRSGNPPMVPRALVQSTLLVSSAELVPFRTLYAGVDIHWQPALTPEKNLEYAVAAILSHLSQRTMRRFDLQSLPSQFEVDNLVQTTVS